LNKLSKIRENNVFLVNFSKVDDFSQAIHVFVDKRTANSFLESQNAYFLKISSKSAKVLTIKISQNLPFSQIPTLQSFVKFVQSRGLIYIRTYHVFQRFFLFLSFLSNLVFEIFGIFQENFEICKFFQVLDFI
jgi:hypothetical protein